MNDSRRVVVNKKTSFFLFKLSGSAAERVGDQFDLIFAWSPASDFEPKYSFVRKWGSRFLREPQLAPAEPNASNANIIRANLLDAPCSGAVRNSETFGCTLRCGQYGHICQFLFLLIQLG